MKKMVVGITGASGAIYGIEFLRTCNEFSIETHLILSDWAEKTIEIETSYTVSEVKSLATYNYDNDNLAAKTSSGSFQHDGMVIVPCSMKSLAAVAYGFSENLIHRSADVTIKESRRLVLVPRETPLSQIHLENMLRLSKMGVTILPPMPAMYINPKSINDVVKHTVSRLMDHLGVENNISKRWVGLGNADGHMERYDNNG